MPSKEQVKELIAQGLDNPEPVATPPCDNPRNKQVVQDWIARRVAEDEQMRFAGAARRAQAKAQEES